MYAIFRYPILAIVLSMGCISCALTEREDVTAHYDAIAKHFLEIAWIQFERAKKEGGDYHDLLAEAESCALKATHYDHSLKPQEQVLLKAIRELRSINQATIDDDADAAKP